MTPTKKPSPRSSSAVLEPPPITKKPRRMSSRAKDPTSEMPLMAPKAAPKARPAKGGRAIVHPIDHQHIAARAYEIFLERGSIHGHDLEDWEQAEMELCGFSANRHIEGNSHLGKSTGTYLR
ncbi:MAG TPA: DUF2934 domain-containing protein [Geothrix sp.]|nr:DUF2934 domain-containing protein [Geothrix sp.]